jgi:hypothetical protein
VKFDGGGRLPALFNALEIHGEKGMIIAEVAKH